MGKVLEVLVLENKNSKRLALEGLSKNYWPVVFKDSSSIRPNQNILAKVVDVDFKLKSFGALIVEPL